MLLPVKTAKTTLIAALLAASVAAVPTNPVLAWGDREQGFVAGVATTVILNEIIKNERHRNATSPDVVYVEKPTHSSTSISRTPAARAFSSYSKAERKAVQRNLRAWGYYRGGIDGSFGPGTYNAVVAYARDEGVLRNLNSTAGAYRVFDSLIF